MKRILLLALLLGACAPQSAVPEPVRVSTAARPVVLNSTLDLEAHPGSRITTLTERGMRMTARFTTGVTLFEVETHFDRQLTLGGWLREGYNPPNGTELRAVYHRAGERLTLRVRLEDPSGQYRLTTR